jgi:hypothetical protein
MVTVSYIRYVVIARHAIIRLQARFMRLFVNCHKKNPLICSHDGTLI